MKTDCYGEKKGRDFFYVAGLASGERRVAICMQQAYQPFLRIHRDLSPCFFGFSREQAIPLQINSLYE